MQAVARENRRKRMIVYLAEITCQFCFHVFQTTKYDIPLTEEDARIEADMLYGMKKVIHDGHWVWQCRECQSRDLEKDKK